MSLAPGVRLGSYEILSKIGEGGMGEVYRARDAKLGRDVALKFLPAAFATDPERLARFQREAHLLASLNHQHIAAIYGLEGSTGRDGQEGRDGKAPVFLVMELVEGEDLSQRIARGAMPLDEALPIAKQIAEALEAAHDQGIIHRDLKPANIKLRPDGNVKILDFGLAKALEGPAKTGHDDLSHSPTITSPAQMTSVGVILGTAAYMAPEQAKGRAVDKRADVWAFGAVLYEMLTGRRAFPGDDLSDTFAAILRADPDWSVLPPATPATIKRLLRRCLEKDARWRVSDMATVRIDLRDAENEPRDVAAAAATSPPPRKSLVGRLMPYAAMIAIALVSGAAVWRVREPAEVSRPLTRFSIDLFDQAQLLTSARNPVAISPDGTHIVFAANQRLYVRAMDQPEATVIPGTEGGTAALSSSGPFFSPDNQWVGFWQDGHIKKVAVAGGAPLTICAVSDVPGGISWEQEEILFDSPKGIMRVAAAGGTPELLIGVKDSERVAFPQMLPGGDWLLFTVSPFDGAVENVQAVVQSRRTGERRVLVENIRKAQYVSSGHLLYARARTLLAQSFDVKHLSLSGTAVPVVDGVASAGLSPIMFYAISPTGTLAYVPSPMTDATTTKLVQVTRDGIRSPLTDVAGMTWFPRYSPDGTRVAFGISLSAVLNDPSDLWVIDLARGARTRVTFKDNNRFYPIWTRDGARLTFADSTAPTNHVLTAPADGSGGTQTLLDTGLRRFPTSWSPDGKTLALYVGGNSSTGQTGSTRDIVVMRADDDKHTLTPFVATPFEERGAIFSPTGRWVAYVSNKSGQNDIFARPYPGPGNEVTISVGGGREPVWGPSGRELFYRQEGKLMVVRIEEGAALLNVGTPSRVFDDPYRLDTGGSQGGMANYDIAPDGKRFVFVEEQRPANTAAQPVVRLQVVLNWFDELKRRAPVK